MSGIYIPGRLQETDPVLFEALCVEMCLAHLGYGAKHVDHLVGKCVDPRATVFPDETKKGDLCHTLRVHAEIYDREIRVAQVDASETDPAKAKVAEQGVGYTKTVECLIMVGPLRCTVEEFPQRRLDAKNAFEAEVAARAEKLFKGSRAWKNIDGIALMLKKKGFEVRR